MKNHKHGIKLMVAEHLSSGEPLTQIEALLVYGVQHLKTEVARLRREGWNIKSRKVTFIEAVRRVNKHASYTPPKNLPTKEIILTDYWLSK